MGWFSDCTVWISGTFLPGSSYWDAGACPPMKISAGCPLGLGEKQGVLPTVAALHGDVSSPNAAVQPGS